MRTHTVSSSYACCHDARSLTEYCRVTFCANAYLFLSMHTLQVPAAGAAAKRNQGNAGEHSDGIPTPPLPHHASFPETAAELVLDLTIAGHNAASSSTAYTGFGDRASPLGQDQVNILNLPLPDFDSMSGEQHNAVITNAASCSRVTWRQLLCCITRVVGVPDGPWLRSVFVLHTL